MKKYEPSEQERIAHAAFLDDIERDRKAGKAFDKMIEGCSWASASFSNACLIFSARPEYGFLKDHTQKMNFFSFIVKLGRRRDEDALSLLTVISKYQTSFIQSQMETFKKLLDLYKLDNGLT